jgi:hypothetical protein
MFRKFIRELKLLDTEAAISQKLADSYPNLQLHSPARTLEAIMVQSVANEPDRNIIEALKVINNVLPKIAGDAVQQSIYLGIRNAIKARYNDDSNPVVVKAYSVMRFDQDKWRANREAYKEKIYAANADKQQIPINKINDVVNMTKKSKNTLDLAVCLEMVCGSRTGEILSFATFTEAKDPAYIKQTGILKQREGSERETVTKPIILVTREEFFDMLKQLRYNLSMDIRYISEGKMTHYELSQKYNHNINSRVKSLFDDRDITTHTLRKIYGHLSYQIYGNRERISEARWLAEVLGHSTESMETAASYSTVGFTDTSDSSTIPRNTKARDGHALDRLLLTVAALRQRGIPISGPTLKKYGYGSNTIDQYMKTNRAPEPEPAAA